jgi:hypothetical protein
MLMTSRSKFSDSFTCVQPASLALFNTCPSQPVKFRFPSNPLRILHRNIADSIENHKKRERESRGEVDRTRNVVVVESLKTRVREVLRSTKSQMYRGSSTNARPHPTPDSVCNTITSTTRNATNMSPIEALLAAIESLKPGEKLVYA